VNSFQTETFLKFIGVKANGRSFTAVRPIGVKRCFFLNKSMKIKQNIATT